jgi:hypothetical protein
MRLDEANPDERVLAAAASAVLAALRGPLEQQQLPGPAVAALRLLETALLPYDYRRDQ